MLDRLKYEVIKESLFGSERIPLVADMGRCWGGGGSGGGRMRRGVQGRIVVEDTTNNLRWGEGSGMRISSKWQLGVFVECMRLRRGGGHRNVTKFRLS